MMCGSTVQLVSRDSTVAEFVRNEIESNVDFAFQWAGEIDEVCCQPLEDKVGLVVVHLDGTISEDDVARLLWVTSIAKHDVPVMALSECYDVEEALMMFRLGVVDYISLPAHGRRLASLAEAVALHTTVPEEIGPEGVFGPEPLLQPSLEHAVSHA